MFTIFLLRKLLCHCISLGIHSRGHRVPTLLNLILTKLLSFFLKKKIFARRNVKGLIN
jgi:hypothetical protein